MQLRTVDVGVPLRYADYGGDGPPIVLLHGLGGIIASSTMIASSASSIRCSPPA